jgi:hypothetical protein
MTDNKKENHPAYGFITMNRVSGGNSSFFMSSVIPQTHIRIKIGHAEKNVSFGESGLHPRGNIVEVALSPAQFSELLTTMNHGSGVPCTLKYIGREPIDPITEEINEMKYVSEYIKESLKEFENKINKQHKEILEILDKKSITLGDKKQILKLINDVLLEVKSNIPFYEKRIKENMDMVISQGKAEIDSFISTVITNTGLKAMGLKIPEINLLKDSK